MPGITAFNSPVTPIGNRTVVSATTYTAKLTDSFIDIDGTSTVTIPTASALYLNQVIWLRKTDANFLVATIAGGISTTLNTLNEAILIQCNGSAWAIIERIIPGPVTDYVPTLVGLGTYSLTGPTYFAIYRRLGEYVEIRVKTLVGTPTGVPITCTLPSGLTANQSVDQVMLGNAGSDYNGAAQGGIVPIFVAASSTVLQFGMNISRSVLSPLNGNTINTTGSIFSFNALIRISGWNG